MENQEIAAVFEEIANLMKINQDDPTHISFPLKPGFMWNGDLGEVTADDVKYSFERMLKSDWAARWPTLEKVDVTDKYNGVIVLKSPFAATFLMGFTLPGARLALAASLLLWIVHALRSRAKPVRQPAAARADQEIQPTGQ